MALIFRSRFNVFSSFILILLLLTCQCPCVMSSDAATATANAKDVDLDDTEVDVGVGVDVDVDVDGGVLSTGENVSAFVEDQIAQNDIMVFAKTYCPYCRRAKSTFVKLLSDLGLEEDDTSYNVIELDELPGEDGWMIQNELMDVTGQRTVPNVFIHGQHIGGNDDVQRLLREETLHDLVQPHGTDL